jgi:hypothetical protein
LSEHFEGEVSCPTAAYSYSPELTICACHFDEIEYEGGFYTDFDDLCLEEVRLLASLALTVGMEDGLRIIYPDPSSIRVPEFLDLQSAGGLAEARALIQQYLANPPQRPMSDPPLPKGRNGSSSDGASILHSQLQQRIFNSIAVEDALLLRGLATWLKAGMLWMHRSFAEEANYALYVSLDASFAKVRNLLRAEGNPSPSAYDAQRYIHDAFDEPDSGYKYFEEFYDDRIRTMHPESRLGTFAYAPLGRDDFYWLFRGLREVWRLLAIGEVLAPPSVTPHPRPRS